MLLACCCCSSIVVVDTMLLLLLIFFTLFTLSAGDIGDIGGDEVPIGGNCHGKNVGCGYRLDNSAAVVICGVNRFIGLLANRPAYNWAASGDIPPTSDDDNSAGALFISSRSCFILASRRIFWNAAKSIIDKRKK